MFPLHMLFFHIISMYVRGLTPTRDKGMHVFTVTARFLFMWPCLHCTNQALVIFKPRPMQCIFQWPQKMKIWRRQTRAIWGWWSTVQTNLTITSWVR